MGNTKFEIWLNNVNKSLETKWSTDHPLLQYHALTYKKGRKFVKIFQKNSVWGFVAMFNGEHKGSPVKEGDLLKPANYSTPAKHSRGNIFDNTAAFDHYGPCYLK